MKKVKNLYPLASNIYRTTKYIVCQDIYIEVSGRGGCNIISKDTYKKRDFKSDRKFEEVFRDRDDLNGSRIHTTMYTRKYID